MGTKKSVYIDARMVDYHLHGIARYTYELIKNISKTNKIKFTLLVNDLNMAKDIFKGIENIDYIVMKSKFLSLGEQLELPRILNKHKEEGIFHSPSFSCSPFLKIKFLMTIHDLNHLRFPEFYSLFHKYYYNYIVKPSALKSEKILTVSQFSKNEIKSWLKCSGQNIVVTYNGIDESFKMIDDQKLLNTIKDKYSLPETFILYVGNQKPHKNVKTLIKAMSLVKEGVILVLNGKESSGLMEIAKKFGLDDKIKFIGFIEDNDLPSIYTLAKMFVFPSLYEGFGLPPLEAMACGCPTIVSDTSSLPEVVGEKGITFEVLNEKALAKEINDLFIDDKKYEECKAYGLKRSKYFTWEKLAQDTILEYENLLRK